MRRMIFFVALCCLPATGIVAWDGTDSDGNWVVIESGNLVRRGQEIEVYNYGTGRYEYLEVEGIWRHGSQVEIEVYDYRTGDYDTLYMDD